MTFIISNKTEITGNNSEVDGETFSLAIHPFMLGSQEIVIRNCTSVDLGNNSLIPGTLDHLRIKILPNDHYNDFGVAFHEKNELAFGVQTPSNDGGTYYVSFDPGKKNYIELYMNQFININSYEDPCEEESLFRKGYLEQLNELYIMEMNCTLPWLKGKSMNFTSFVNFKTSKK